MIDSVGLNITNIFPLTSLIFDQPRIAWLSDKCFFSIFQVLVSFLALRGRILNYRLGFSLLDDHTLMIISMNGDHIPHI